MKLCKDCTHFREGKFYEATAVTTPNKCYRLGETKEPVYGMLVPVNPLSPYAERKNLDGCGPEGKYHA